MNKFKSYIPLIVSLVFLTLMIIIIFNECLKISGGKFIYALDDAYIHLAFAKNIVVNNVQGITQYESSSSSSSPLWTLILISIFYLTGINEFIPLILNIIISFVLITVAFCLFKKYSAPNLFSTISLLTLIIITPVALNIFSGMEHLLQSILVILFIYFSAQELTRLSPSPDKVTKSDIRIFILSALLISIRYEDLIVVLVVSGLFFFRKKYLKAFLILICGIIPALIYGLISIKNGGYFIPNSILVKINLPESVSIITGANVFESLYRYLNFNKKIVVLFFISLLMFILQLRLKKSFLTEITLMLFIIISVILIQKIVLPASYFRYEVYLVISSIIINAIAINDYLTEKYKINIDFAYIRKSKIAFIIVMVILIFLMYKCFETQKVITASRNIFEQQYQMSRFINKYYSGKEVALNDIGAVNYFADIHCTDLIGIGNNEIMSERIKRNFNTKSMNEIAERNKVVIAVLYEKWFDMYGGIPQGWIKSGEWKIQDNYVCGDDVVSFYAVSPGEKINLEANLKSFSAELPESVIQSGKYMK